MKRKAAFTLIELLIVVIIIGILAVSAVPIYWFSLRRTLSAEGFATLGAIRSAQRLRKAEFGTYLAVTRGTTDTNGIYAAFGLDTRDNHFWDNRAFSVTVAGTPPNQTFIATASGAQSRAVGHPRVSDITLTINQEGTTTGP